MHLRKRTGSTGTRWQCIVKREGRTWHRTFSTRAKAERWGGKLEEQLDQGHPAPQVSGYTVADAINRYLREVMPRKRPSTARTDTRRLEVWKGLIGHRRLSAMSPSLMVEARDSLATDRTPATVNRYLNCLSHVMKLAAGEWQWCDKNPLRGVQRLREPPGRVRWLEREEITRLLDACKRSDAPYLYALVVLALTTGCRRGELLGLEWRHIDFGRGLIRLEQTKTHERRTLHLVGDAADALRSMPRRLGTDLVFPGKDPTRPIDPRWAWDKALERADIEDFRFHDLRHTAASYLAMSGATEREIAEMLGHKTMAMVKRYSHLSTDHMKGVSNLLRDAVLGDP